jgi:hypothetical protein
MKLKATFCAFLTLVLPLAAQTDKPPLKIQEWERGSVVGADGNTIKCSVSFHNANNAGGFKLERAMLHLRKIEKGSGKVLAHLQMAMDDPNSQTEPKGVAWDGVEFDIALKLMERHLIVATGRFMAEVDLNLGKVLRSYMLPAKWQGHFYYTEIASDGAYVFRYNDPDSKKNYLVTLPGKEPREVAPMKPNWKIVSVINPEEIPRLFVVCLSPDKQSWAAGAYDPVKDTWDWVKTDAALAQPVPGTSQKLVTLHFDSRNLDTEAERQKWRGKWIVDASNGELRQRLP